MKCVCKKVSVCIKDRFFLESGFAYMFGELIPSSIAFLKKSFQLQMYISFRRKALDYE